ncbi:MAG: DUF3488 domain-containing transglutaminase family protein [Gammaproteobacteria bacterium]|nr:DUF3488 domain-containing transglutaminase family protein [Gammaproteobacteria bacterium]
MTQSLILPPSTLAWLLASLTTALLPHLLRTPLWIALFCLAIMVWRAAISRKHKMAPGRVLRFAVTLTALAGVYSSYGTLLGKDAGIALLVLMLTLKLLELKKRRDIYLVIFLGYFVVISHFLYSQSIATATYMMLVVLLLTATLVEYNRSAVAAGNVPPTLNLGANLRLAALLLAQALPLMLIMFVLFPRLASPLWGLPDGSAAGVTGLSDSMSPGSISHLSQSDAVVLRATFDDPLPPPNQRYWRGPVLWHYDGRSWSPGSDSRQPAASNQRLRFEKAGPAVNYHVTLQATDGHWLLALELPATIPDGAYLTADLQLRSVKPNNRLKRYAMVSYPQFRTLQLSNRQRAQALQLPKGHNPQLLNLGRSWRLSSANPQQIVERALAMYRNEPFIYTLMPPTLHGSDAMDQFLFDSQRGFCEHYASSFVLLMRAAGIPARVITGYQGGEYNTQGDYLVVRQKEAHAWAEVWMDGRGWQRVDPTAAVAPQRIELGLDISGQQLGSALRFNVAQPDWLRALSKKLRDNIDAANHRWNQWVLDYNTQRQMKFLSRLGIFSWSAMAIWLSTLIALTLALIALRMWLRQRPPKDPVEKAYQRFCRQLERRGITRNPAEGPQHFSNRVARLRPELSFEVKQISALYIALRYGKGCDEKDCDGHSAAVMIKRLCRQVRQFKA